MYPCLREEVRKLAREKKGMQDSIIQDDAIDTYVLQCGWERESTTNVIFVGEYGGRGGVK